MESVEHDGRSTAYRAVAGEGLGPTTLYVHGSGGSHHVWVNQYAPDGPVHPAAALDLTGHGDSPDVDDGIEDERVLETYVEDVVAVAEEIGASVLVGNSLGGAVVATVALEHSLEPSAIVLAGAGARLLVDETLRALLAEDLEGALDLLHGDDVFFHDANERVQDRSRSTMRGAGRAVVRRDFAACHAFDIRDRLDEIDCPTLALVGEYDRLTPPTAHRVLAEELPDCRCRLIDDAAHLAMLDRPSAFNDAVRRFLDDL